MALQLPSRREIARHDVGTVIQQGKAVSAWERRADHDKRMHSHVGRNALIGPRQQAERIDSTQGLPSYSQHSVMIPDWFHGKHAPGRRMAAWLPADPSRHGQRHSAAKPRQPSSDPASSSLSLAISV